MPAAAGAISKAVARGWPVVVKNWPRIVGAVGLGIKFVHDNPAVSERARGLLADVQRRLVEIQLRRGDAARIRGALDMIRDVVGRSQDDDQVDLDADAYLRRATRIEQAVKLAEQQDKPLRKATLARLKAQTDVLLAELISAVVGSRSASTDDSARADAP